jgi:hypothetical protein
MNKNRPTYINNPRAWLGTCVSGPYRRSGEFPLRYIWFAVGLVAFSFALAAILTWGQ